MLSFRSRRIRAMWMEWYTAPTSFDADLGMYSVGLSSTMQERTASVIAISDVLRSCHLVPQWGKSIPRHWSSEDVLDQAHRFYVNPYLRLSDFVLLRYLPLIMT